MFTIEVFTIERAPLHSKHVSTASQTSEIERPRTIKFLQSQDWELWVTAGPQTLEHLSRHNFEAFIPRSLSPRQNNKLPRPADITEMPPRGGTEVRAQPRSGHFATSVNQLISRGSDWSGDHASYFGARAMCYA